MNVPRLITCRLTLRAVDERDIDAITRVAGEYNVSKWLVPVPHPYSRDEAEAFVGDVHAGKHGMIWAVEREGACIGLVGLGPELGYWLDPAHWRQGYMTEAVFAAINWWFANTDCDEIPCAFFNGNIASSRIQEKLGFEEIGDRMSHSLARGEDVPSRRTVLTRARWSGLRAGAD